MAATAFYPEPTRKAWPMHFLESGGGQKAGVVAPLLAAQIESAPGVEILLDEDAWHGEGRARWGHMTSFTTTTLRT